MVSDEIRHYASRGDVARMVEAAVGYNSGVDMVSDAHLPSGYGNRTRKYYVPDPKNPLRMIPKSKLERRAEE